MFDRLSNFRNIVVDKHVDFDKLITLNCLHDYNENVDLNYHLTFDEYCFLLSIVYERFRRRRRYGK